MSVFYCRSEARKVPAADFGATGAFYAYGTMGRIPSLGKRLRHSNADNTGSTLKARRYNIDLGAHLAECDGNYLRLTRLMPDLERQDRRVFRILLGAAVLRVTFEVIDRNRYTTVIVLSQRSGVRGVAEIKIKVRLYHDARCAEVIEFQGQRRFEPVYQYPNAKMRQPDEKAQVNRFLREFLNACLRHGVANQEPAMIGS